ncbi:MAG: CaiB/BaiF CoA transferase family protein [Rhizobiaceae bacterium]
MLPLLSDITVLDLSSIVMGPMATQALGDLGADIIKIEPPDGDLARASGTLGPDGTGALFANNNRNKRSIVLDLKNEDDRNVLDRMVMHADVLLHNLRPAAAKRLGLDSGRLLALNPRLVHCITVGYGSDGPFAERPAYDDVIQAAAGLASLPSETGGGPAFVPSIVADKVTGLYAVQAVLAALHRREHIGQGCAVEVPMFECLVSFLFNEHLDAASFGENAVPGYRRLLTEYRRPHATADGFLAILPYSEAHWRRTLKEFGRQDILDAGWYSTPAGRNAHSAELYQAISECLAERETSHWIDRFEELDIPYSPINSMRSLLDHPHLAAKEFFRPRDNTAGRVRSVPQPVRFSGMEEAPDRAAPRRNADMQEILAQFGFGEDEIARISKGGVP